MPPKGTELELPEDATAALEELSDVFALVEDEARPWTDRAAVWQALHQLQLVVNRVLKRTKPAIVFAMDRGGVERAGRLRLKWKPKEVEWRCNDPTAWTDEQVQHALEGLMADPMGRLFVTVIPAHLEVNTKYLGAAMMSPSTVAPRGVGPEALQEYARALYDEAKRRAWRVELVAEPTVEVMPLKR